MFYNAIDMEYGTTQIPSTNKNTERRYLYAKLANGAIYKWNTIVDLSTDTHLRMVKQYIAMRKTSNRANIRCIRINPKFWTKVS